MFVISSIYDCCMCGVTPPFSIKSWSWISETWSNWTTSSLSGKSKNRLQQKKIIVWIWHHKKAVPFPPLSTPTNFQTFFGQFYSSNIQTNLRLPDFLQQKIQQTYTIKFSYLVEHLQIKSLQQLLSPTSEKTDVSLKLTTFAPENEDHFPFGTQPTFRGELAVSFREV